jgi:PKD repeat protein
VTFSVANDADSFHWDFGDGNKVVTTGQSITHEFTLAEEHLVTVETRSSGSNAIGMGAISILVAPGALHSIVIEPSEISVSVSDTTTTCVAAFDRFGNRIPDIPVRFDVADGVGTIGESGNFTAGIKAGLFKDALEVTALTGTVSKRIYRDIEILAGPLHAVKISPAEISVAVDGSQVLQASGVDQFGNIIHSSQVRWEIGTDFGTLSADGVFTAGPLSGTAEAGVRAIVTSGETVVEGTASVTVAPGPPARIELPPITLAAGESRKLNPVLIDAYGNQIGTASARWTVTDGNVGSITSDGVFTAGYVAGVYPNSLLATVRGNETSLTTATSVTVTPVL